MARWHAASAANKPIVASDITISGELAASMIPAPGPASKVWSWVLMLSFSFSYALTYFWRYPVFVLPPEILQQPVCWRSRCLPNMNLQACISLAFILGFGSAKPFAATVASSSFFFRRRLRVLLALIVGSMLVEGLGLLSEAPVVKIGAVYVSAFFSSWLYGMMVTILGGLEPWTTTGRPDSDSPRFFVCVWTGHVLGGPARHGGHARRLHPLPGVRWQPHPRPRSYRPQRRLQVAATLDLTPPQALSRACACLSPS